MIKRTQTAVPALLGRCLFILLLSGVPSFAAEQIIALTDDHGHKVYINVPVISAATRRSIVASVRPVRSNPSLPPEEVGRLVSEAAARQQIDPKLVHSIIQVESGYDPNAVSNKGAMGLMQLVEGTAKRFGVENPFDPKQNIDGGVSYLRYLLDLFGGDVTLSLAAYNAGENSVRRFGGVPTYQETRAYVRKVNHLYAADTPQTTGEPKSKEPAKAPIYRYVDARGVVHYTNGYEF